MMRAARRCLAAVVVLLVLAGVPATAQATSSEGTVAADLPTPMNGQVAADAEAAELLVPTGQVRGLLTGDYSYVQVVTYEERYKVEGAGASVDRVSLVSADREIEEFHLFDGSIALDGAEATLFVRSIDELRTRVDAEPLGPDAIRWEDDASAVLHASEGHVVAAPLISDQPAYREEVLPGAFGLYADAVRATARGSFSVYVFDATVSLTPSDGDPVTVETGRRLYMEDARSRVRHEVPLTDAAGAGKPGGGDGSIEDLMTRGGGPGLFAVHETTYVVVQTRPLEGGPSVLDVAASSPKQVYAYSEDVTVRLIGTVRLADAVGHLRVDDEAYAFDHDEVLISGALTLTPRPDDRTEDGSVPYEVRGDIEYLRVGSVTHDLGREEMVAIVIGLAVGAAGVMAYLWPLLKFGLFNLLGAPLYSRFKKDEVLDHDVRSTIYDIIKEDPGISISRVADRASVGWGTAVYHLNVLEENGLVVAMRDGRYKRYYQNGGRYNGKKEALAAIRNDTTKRVVDAVLHNPGITQTGLCEQLGISAPLAHWHLSRLKDADVIDQERDGRYKRHYVKEWSKDVLQAYM